MLKARRGRPVTGCPKWNVRRQIWQARVPLSDGRRCLVDMPGIPEADEARAMALAPILARKAATAAPEPSDGGETVKDWADRWLAERKARGIASVGHDRSRLKNHVLPIIGPRPIAKVTREDVERVVDDLDRKILLDTEDDEHLEWKTASNVWVIVTKMFDDAVNAKRRDLRARSDNPAKDVKGPERGEAKAKQYLYPSEFTRLVAFNDEEKVPLRMRTLYAAAVYTFARAGELEALTWDDVDLEHGVIHITKAVDRKTGEVKSTKSGETRRVPIEANLRPLLERLHAERKRGASGKDRVLWMPPDEDRAISLREHLLLVGVKRAELFMRDAQRKNITFHDLRATGITWMAVRGDDPLRIKTARGSQVVQHHRGVHPRGRKSLRRLRRSVPSSTGRDYWPLLA